jgi:hypothetical protein
VRSCTLTRTRFSRPGTLFGVAKSLIKVRLAELAPDAGAQDSGIPEPGFIKRDLIRGCRDPFRVCFQLVSTTALSLLAFRIIDAIVVREGPSNFRPLGFHPGFLFICGHRSPSVARVISEFPPSPLERRPHTRPHASRRQGEKKNLQRTITIVYNSVITSTL